MKNIIVSIIAMIAMSSNTYAECKSWGCNSKIQKLLVTNTGKIVVATDGDEKKANCTPIAGIYLTISPSTKGSNSIYSLLLTAKSLDKKVILRVSEGTKNCEIQYASLSN